VLNSTGLEVTFVNTAAVNNVNIMPAAGETLNNGQIASYTLLPGAAVTFRSDGVSNSWLVATAP
jgi:hypothetical protein